MTVTLAKISRRAIRERGAIYHLHDPELIPLGIALKLAGRRVIYDAHEELPKQVLGKSWIPRPLRRPTAGLARLLEWLAGRAFDAVIAATPAIAAAFISSKTVIVQNFPLLGELEPPTDSQRSQGRLIFVGGITEARGAREMVEAISLIPPELSPRLTLVGEMPPALRKVLVKLPGWQHTDAVGWKGRKEVASLLAEASVGLVVFHPLPNHLASYPTKLFEYMAAGLPVIASDFPTWRDIVTETQCGVTANPLNPRAIAEAAEWLFEHPREAEEMGRRGSEAVRVRYNWEAEEVKLLRLYQRLGRDPKP